MSKPFVLIKLDKEREFKLGNKAFIYFEEIIGKKASNIDMNDMGIKELNALIYAGLKCKDKNITFDETIDLIDDYGNIEELSNKLQEAMNNSNFFKSANNKTV